MRRSRWIEASILIVTALLDVSGSHAQAVCDPGLTGSSNSPMAYSMRGDRCEGIYALQVNSTEVRLASLVESFTLDPKNDAPLVVRWPELAGHEGPVRLRAQSMRPRSYYRMDTATDDATSFTWPTAILGTIGLNRDEVGVLGWVEQALGSEEREVYLPLRIAQEGTGTSGSSYEVALIPDIRLRDVKVTLTPVDAEGVEGEPIIDKEPLIAGYYPAKEATFFTLPKPELPGLYSVELTCDRMSTGIATTTFWFYHSE